MEMNEPFVSPNAAQPSPGEEARLAAETQRIRQIIDAYAEQTAPDPSRLQPLEDWLLRMARSEMLRGPRLVLIDAPGIELSVLLSTVKARIRSLVDAHPQARARAMSITARPQTEAMGGPPELVVDLSIDIVCGAAAPLLVGELRDTITAALSAELGAEVSRLDVSVRDVIVARTGPEAEGQAPADVSGRAVEQTTGEGRSRAAGSASGGRGISDGGSAAGQSAPSGQSEAPAAQVISLPPVADLQNPGSAAAASALMVPGVAGLTPSLRDRFDGFVNRSQAGARTVDVIVRRGAAEAHLDCLLDGSRPATAIAAELAEAVGPAVREALQSAGTVEVQQPVSDVRLQVRIIELGS